MKEKTKSGMGKGKRLGVGKEDIGCLTNVGWRERRTGLS